ncbi:hypothetical protein BGX29_012176 [Mortierella sp. GBA35]|nr:hypothetical protein BGX29_012176 [Mortierella sp. GBA35]
MAPGESIRGQIHLELPKATPVHSIEVCLTGTVTALDGTRLGSMKTVTILEECKTVATASITNTRTNTTRRHTTPSPSATTSVATGAAVAAQESTATTTGRRRRASVMGADQSRSPTFPLGGGIATAASTAAAATIAAQGNSRRLSTELMSRTLSMPSSSTYYAHNASTLSLNRPVSPTPADLRGRRTSFSANVDVPIGAFNSLLGGGGIGWHNMSMVNISTIGQSPIDGGQPEPSEPEAPAPSYDPPNYEGIFTSSARSTTEESSSADDVVSAPVTTSITTEEPSSTLGSAPLAAEEEDTATPVSAPLPTPSPSITSEDVSTHSSRSSRDGRSDPTPTTATTTPAAAAEPVEPKAVLMQPGNYVIPFSIRIPSNATMSLPGSFTDPVGAISYQLKAVMRQIVPSPDPYNPRALHVEPTFTSSTQVIKLIPMNDPTFMPLYNSPFETESVRANVGHWVWSTGFLEAHAWVPKQGYRPGRMVPLVIHIVNHSDARQVVVETTLCKCLHYGSGLSKVRAMGIAGQGYLMDPTLTSPSVMDVSDDMSFSTPSQTEEAATATATATTETSSERRRRSGRRSSSNRNSRQQQQSSSTRGSVMPSPPASPYGSNIPSTPTSDQGGESPEGSVHGAAASAAAAATARMTSPSSMASISSQWGSIHSNSSDSNNSASQVSAAIQAYNSMSGNINTTLNSNGGVHYNPAADSRSTMTSPTPSAHNTITSPPQQAAPLPIIQHQREKLTKSKTLINCSMAVDREIQKTIPVMIPHTAGYSILNAPLLEVSYEVVIKIRAEKNSMYSSRGVRLSVPIVVVVPEEGDLEDDEDEFLASAGLTIGGGGSGSASGGGGDLGLAFSGDEYEFGDQGECPPYEVTASSGSRRRSRR